MKNIFDKKINKILAVAAVLVIAALIAVLAPKLFQKSKPASQSSGTQGGLAGGSTVQKKPPAEVIKNCTGTILEINGNIIKLKAEKDRNPFSEDRYFDITVNKDTKILKQEGGSFDVRTDDQGKMVFTVRIGANAGAQNGSQQWKTLNIADLKAGNSIATEGSENLRNKDSFTAVYIIAID